MIINSTVVGGGISPTGTISIISNGTYNVAEYENASVAVSSENIEKPIRFFDYDGTLIAAYTSVPESLPPIPVHEGLVTGAWNYTLQQLTDQFNDTGTCDVGVNYFTASGATEIDIEFVDPYRLSPNLGVAVNGSVTVDWGDSSTDVINGSSLYSQLLTPHTYSQIGKYTITITPVETSTYAFVASSSTPLPILNGGTKDKSTIYANCIKFIRIGDGCSIGSYAFYNLNQLESISMHPNISSIPTYAFAYCYALRMVAVPANAVYAYQYAFNNCSSLIAVSLPCNLRLNSYMFNNCSKLSRITFPKGATSIDQYTCQNCMRLEFVAFSSGTTSIYSNAFAGSLNIKYIKLPNGLTSIATNAFSSCRITSITIPDGCIVGSALASGAFSYCTLLQTVTLPSNASSVGGFNACTSLRNVVIPEGVSTISVGAFSSCSSFTCITIPSSVNSIGNTAFAMCTSMKEYHLKPITPPTINSTNVFTSIPADCIIYVPSESLEDYKTANYWGTYADHMQGE